MSTYQNEQIRLNDSLRANTLDKSKLFTRKKIKLDVARTFNDDEFNRFKETFRAFWIVNYSTKNFEAELKLNIKNEFGDSLPLRPNMCYDVGELVDGAVFEYPAQAGAWIEVLFFHKGAPTIANIELDTAAAVQIAPPVSFSSGQLSVTTTPQLLVAANDLRSEYIIENNSAYDIYIGQQADLAALNFKDICRFVPAGGELVWRNTSGLYLRTESSPTSAVKYFEENR